VVAEVEGGLVERELVEESPEVELIAVRAAVEAAEEVAVEVGGEAASVAGGLRVVKWAGAAKL
jgi:hypothetical protein